MISFCNINLMKNINKMAVYAKEIEFQRVNYKFRDVKFKYSHNLRI